jgi:pimeloyl-ACP methyl ester carboxylesterase
MSVGGCSVVPLTPLTAGLSLAESVATRTFAEFAPIQPDKSTAELKTKYTNESSAFLDLPGAHVHYRDEGPRGAPTVLALHGTYSSLHTWDDWVEQLTEEYRVVSIDMPGFGLTGPPEGRHTLERLIQSVGLFCDELGLEDVIVAGNSLGGAVAWRLSLKRPDLVSQLVLVDAGGATLLSNIANNFLAFGTDILPRYATPRLAIRMILNDAYGDTSKITPELVNRYYDLLLRSGNRRAVIDIARNYRDKHYPDDADISELHAPMLPSAYDPSPHVWDGYDISEVSVPALFQWGTEDKWLPESFGRELASSVPDSQFVAYEGVGHAPMEEAPLDTASDVATFLPRSTKRRPVAPTQD